MSENKVNGWSNYQTWTVSIYFDEHIIELLQTRIEEENYSTSDLKNTKVRLELIENIRDYIEFRIDENLGNNVNSFIESLMNIEAINYHELLETYIEEAV